MVFLNKLLTVLCGSNTICFRKNGVKSGFGVESDKKCDFQDSLFMVFREELFCRFNPVPVYERPEIHAQLFVEDKGKVVTAYLQ